MNKYDIVIVGASTAGSYYARKMAEKGYSVLMIDKSSREKISPEYDIFHMEKSEMERFGLPEVKEGDGIYEFEFSEQYMMSSFSNYPKSAPTYVVGMHKHGYIVLMNDWAIEAGAEIVYEAAFDSLTYDENGKITTHYDDNADGKVDYIESTDENGKTTITDVRGTVQKIAETIKNVFFTK